MKSATAVFVVFCLVNIHDAHAKVKVLKKSHVEHERRLVFTHASYVDERLAYALCDKNPPTNEISCTVIREKQPYGDDVYSCNVTINRENSIADGEPHIQLFPFGDRYVTLNSWDRGSWNELRFTTVQLDSCKFVETKFNASIDDHYYGMKFVAHNDYFDVFHHDSGECGDNECKVTINADGKIINQEKNSSIGRYIAQNMAKQSIIALDDSSTMGGYFYVKSDGREIVHTLVEPDETEKSLSRHPRSETMYIAVSIKNNLIGECYQTPKEYNCSQYDLNGKLKLHTEIARDHEDKMLLDDVYNSPNGGIYVFSRVCEILNQDMGECYDGIIRYVIERVDARGSKSQPLTFQIPSEYLSLNYGHTSLFFENESEEICVSLVIFNSRQSNSPTEGIGRLYSTANCFTDADFIQ